VRDCISALPLCIVPIPASSRASQPPRDPRVCSRSIVCLDCGRRTRPGRAHTPWRETAVRTIVTSRAAASTHTHTPYGHKCASTRGARTRRHRSSVQELAFLPPHGILEHSLSRVSTAALCLRSGRDSLGHDSRHMPAHPEGATKGTTRRVHEQRAARQATSAPQLDACCCADRICHLCCHILTGWSSNQIRVRHATSRGMGSDGLLRPLRMHAPQHATPSARASAAICRKNPATAPSRRRRHTTRATGK